MLVTPDGRCFNYAIHSVNSFVAKNLFLFEVQVSTLKKCWLLQMEDVLIKGETFDLKYVQEKLLCLMQEEWANKIPTLPKLRYYVKFKSDIVTASYLKANITRTQRSLLAQLRLGILPLAVETDRYYRIPLANRLCRLCDENVIEDTLSIQFQSF